ncbi:hypothetical protein SK128_028098 [Halocaridina rubra]|uniref:Uncharacterized protein n=1 Tax=Halocaridina rubra TaxID=373956 RepID=A0AAN9AEB7_HALRR
MIGLVSITHLLSTTAPAFASFSHVNHSNTGLGQEASTMPAAVSSLPCTPLEEEERPLSSLSTASKSSRIPRLTRSVSLRLKPTSDNRTTPESKYKCETRPVSRTTNRGIVRSASFVTSRGMGGTSPPSLSSSSMTSSYHHPSSSASSPRVLSSASSRGMGHLTPETPRRFSYNTSTTSSFSRRLTSTVERKTHSYAGLGPYAWNYPNQHRRPNFLPISSASCKSYGPPSLPLTPASQPDTPSRSPETDLDDGGGEADSVKSFGSVNSALSCDAAIARQNHHGSVTGGYNSGSCWGSGRNKSSKYVLHCRHSHELDPDTYLTPTQRAARKIRELKAQLAEARREVQARDTEISRLTRELVELRLLKARNQKDESTNAIEEGSQTLVILPNEGREEVHPEATVGNTLISKTSSTPSEGSEPELSRLMDNLNTDSGVSNIPAASPAGGSVAETTEDSVDLTRSLADSGNYDDLTSPCLSSRDPFEASRNSLRGRPTDGDEDEVDPWAAVEETESRLREEYERHVDQLKRNHMDEYHELKEKHNDRVESLLSKLSDANLKYFELRPLYDRSQEKTRELEREITKLKEELTEAELRHQKMYLQMFLKGQQAAKLQADSDLVMFETYNTSFRVD